jgi:hypothetical protein
MAKQKGIVSFIGTINGMNFYLRKGVPVVRATGGGFNGERIKTQPEMVRVRENSSEFGRVSKAKKLFRLGLHPFLKDVADVTLHGRLMRLFQAIKVLDTVSARGERRFEKGLVTPEGHALLLDFALTHKKASVLLPGKGHFEPTTLCYTVTGLILKNAKLPKGATGLQISLGVLTVDFENEVPAFYKSEPLRLDAAFTATTFSLTPVVIPTGTEIKIAVLQVQYYQEVNGAVYLFKELGLQGLEVLEVF